MKFSEDRGEEVDFINRVFPSTADTNHVLQRINCEFGDLIRRRITDSLTQCDQGGHATVLENRKLCYKLLNRNRNHPPPMFKK